MRFLLLLFIAGPFVELWLLLRINDSIGLPKTLMLIVATGLIGAALTKRQGLNTLKRMQEQTRQGQSPGAAIVDGVMILAAGLLLITPGVITDGVGFLLLIPPARAVLRSWIGRSLRVQTMRFGSGVFGNSSSQKPNDSSTPFPSGASSRNPQSAEENNAASATTDDVIDVEYEVRDKK